MKRYSVEQFMKLLINDVDVVYGSCSLNAATSVPSRIRKKHLIEALSQISNDENGVYSNVYKDDKGRTIAKLV